jgi:hypothetical protein
MQIFFTLLVALAIFAVVINANSPTETANLLNRKDLTQQGRALGSKFHECIFAVKRQNMDNLKKFVDDVSYPTSKMYGKHMSRSALADMTSNPVATASVLEYLKKFPQVEVVKQSKYGEFITARAPISTWESIFSAEFFDFDRISASGKTMTPISRALEYSIPTELVGQVSSVFNTVQMPTLARSRVPFRTKVVGRDVSNPAIIQFGTVTPALLNQFCECSTLYFLL